MKPKKNLSDWTAQSWRNKPIKQLPEYPDQAHLKRVQDKLATLPPLVSADEIQCAKEDLSKVVEGKAFLLQGGDCAESFSEFSTATISDTFRVLLQMAGIFTFVGNKQIIRMGRFAGQFAKPRSSDTEIRNGTTLPSYRGDIINGNEFNIQSRTPDPERILKAYYQSATTLNFLRTYSNGKYADLQQILHWTLEFIRRSPARAHYAEVAKKSKRSLEFMGASGGKGMVPKSKSSIDFYTSHEGLHLPYEEALTRKDPLTGEDFAMSAHFLWLGNRTRDPGGAHVEYLRGISNPIGIKCGANMPEKDLEDLLSTLNPSNESGKITLISRMGRGNIKKHLSPLIQVVKKMGSQVIWSCDPMHGNTKDSATGQKTRHFDDILTEIREFFEVCHSEGVYPGGIHLEMTGKNVTECVGGAKEIDLNLNYETVCDPRLNGEQAVELAFTVCDLLKKISKNS